MGCASSTPMIASAGSEMLKTASHVATDVAKSAEDAVQDVTQSLGKSLETTKETVGTAVTGIANELGNAFKEKTDMLDDAKNNLMGKLHIGGIHEDENNLEKKLATATATAAAATEIKHAVENNATPAVEGDVQEVDIERSEDDIPTRAPSPTAAHDADSLKTSTPEPEIEQALANFMENSPPTPKPNIAELEKLTTEAVDKTTAAVVKETEALKEKIAQAVESVTVGESKAAPSSEPPAEKNSESGDERPSTTEWEKYADMLCQSRKFNPSDAFRLGGKFKNPTPHAPTTTVITAAIQHPNTHVVVNRLLEPNDSGLSDSSSARSHNDRRDHLLPHTLNASNSKKFQREFASLIACEPNPLHRISSSKSPGLTKKFNNVTTPSRSRSRAQSPAKATAAFSPLITRSFTNNYIQLSKTSPNLSRSSTRNSLFGSTKNLHNGTKSTTATITKHQTLPSLSASVNHQRCKSPASGFSDNFLIDRHGTTMGLLKSPSRVMNTSSFLSSPRASPFSVRKQYTDLLDPDHRPSFVTDLSSINAPKNVLAPSPYKIRERCLVCSNKYVIK